MRVRTETGLAVNILVALGAMDEGCTRAMISKLTGLQVSKCAAVLHTLCEKGLVDAEPIGGQKDRFIYTIAGAPDEITLEEIFEIFEGEFINGVCLFCKRQCRKGGNAKKCPFGNEMFVVANEISKRLDSVTIQSLINRDEAAEQSLYMGSGT